MSSEAEGTSEKMERVFTVKNKMGIHARPAAMLVRVANKFPDTECWVEKDGESINGKSIMGLMMLAAGKDSELRFITEGPDSPVVLDELEQLFENKFEEA